ncbi:MmoB/DmpM family protein [Novosphingobium profundi]|uniref:MmoB/DmpM family protein n=1 Tax=Novosphingobium profundi TaxID=1774954 RepID=UPI001FE41D92|nr:MmoB/DmpM family protein [Novosphingobium profundi]MBT0670122.1 MmoB/DmpM family protein [Novosphingobium profundi]
MSEVKSTVFLCLQANDETRGVIEAIERDNEHASFDYQPGMVRITAPGTLTVRRETVEEEVGREFDLQELHINMISLSGHVDEDDDALVLSWDR